MMGKHCSVCIQLANGFDESHFLYRQRTTVRFFVLTSPMITHFSGLDENCWSWPILIFDLVSKGPNFFHATKTFPKQTFLLFTALIRSLNVSQPKWDQQMWEREGFLVGSAHDRYSRCWLECERVSRTGLINLLSGLIVFPSTIITDHLRVFTPLFFTGKVKTMNCSWSFRTVPETNPAKHVFSYCKPLSFPTSIPPCIHIHKLLL